MGRIMISADSPADFPKELIDRYDVRIAPLHVILDGVSYNDGVDITPEDIFSRYDSEKILPSTSAVSISEYSEFFKGILNEGYTDIIHLCMSSEMSSTYQNAVIASEDMENVRILDSRNITSCISMLALKACRLRDTGFSAKEIYERISDMRDKVSGSFIIDKLEFLKKGGRCSGIAALGANVLGIKPCIEIAGGKMSPGKKYRGKTEVCQLKYVSDRIAQFQDNIDTDILFITSTHGFDPQQIENIKKEIRKKIKFKEVIINTAGCVISAHCGKNTMGIIFMTK